MIYSIEANQIKYPFILTDLPYSKDVFKPYFSAETFDYHHGKHHQAYVTNLNNLLQAHTELHNSTLEEIILWANKNNNTGIFNNAAQIWNHTFFWHSITPQKSNINADHNLALITQINKNFGSYDNFKTQFKQAAITQFGSGWAWLVVNKNYDLQILKTDNAKTPITEDFYPLLACDVWEHSYYIDYRNKRPDYIDVYLEHLINLDFASKRLNR